MNKMRAASVAMTWSELESYANNLSTTFSDTQHFREQGPTNARATYRSFNTTATKEDARVVLYRDNHAWCPYCQKVWLWLEEKQVPYRIEKVTMFCYGQKESWFKKIVPSGMLPALALDGVTITESDDILMTLEDEFGALGGKGMNDASVLPLRRMERQLFRSWCQWLCYPSRSSREEANNQLQFQKMAKVVDDHLGKTKGPYFLGQELCTADVIFTPYIERMAASLYYYKGYDIKSQNPNIQKWFEAMETRETYLGTQSDYHTHAHDLPPQMGGCYTNNSAEAKENADLIDAGLLTDTVPEVSHEEPATSMQEVIHRMLRHHDTISAINPYNNGVVDEALRCALTNMATGKHECVPPTGTDTALRYVKDRISVPRDMSIWAGKRLRTALEATAQLDGFNASHPIPIKHRRDQGCAPFREARINRGEGMGNRNSGESKSSKSCGAM